MKKFIYIILLLTVLTNLCFSSPSSEKIDIDEIVLESEINEILNTYQTKKVQTFIDGKLSKITVYNNNKNIVSLEKYDHQENLIEKKYFDEDDSVKSMTVIQYLYDNQNNKIEENEQYYNYDPKFIKSVNSDLTENSYYFKTELTRYLYDKRNNLLKVIYANNNFNTFEYDAFNNLIKETHYNQESVITWKYEYLYNENHKIIKEYRYNGDVKLDWEHTYEYNTDGDLIISNYLSDSTESNVSYIYDFDENSNITRIIESEVSIDARYSEPVETQRVDITYYEYNDNNLLNMEKFYYNDQLHSKIFYLYNELNQLIQKLHLESCGCGFFSSVLTQYVYSNDVLIEEIIFAREH